MIGKKFSSALVLIAVCLLALTACAEDPYRDYASSGLEAKGISFRYEDRLENYDRFDYHKAEIFTDSASYSLSPFAPAYSDAYFEQNDLLIFVVSCCSSDEMEFCEILEKDGTLYPLFYRKKIGKNQPVTDDIIVMPYCVELPKAAAYQAGEILYRYR